MELSLSAGPPQVLSFHNVSQLGVLLPGVGTQALHTMERRDLAQLLRSTTSLHLSALSATQQLGILSKVRDRPWASVMGLGEAFYEPAPLDSCHRSPQH